LELRLEAMRSAPPNFLDFQARNGVRTPRELLDHMTHVGQLAILRRLAESPIPRESFLETGTKADNTSSKQPLQNE